MEFVVMSSNNFMMYAINVMLHADVIVYLNEVYTLLYTKYVLSSIFF